MLWSSCAVDGWQWEHRGRVAKERESERICHVCVCAHKRGRADRSGPRVCTGLCACVQLGLQTRSGTQQIPPTHPLPLNLDGTAWCVHSRPGRLKKILPGINNSQKHCEGWGQRKQRGCTERADKRRDWRKPEHRWALRYHSPVHLREQMVAT